MSLLKTQAITLALTGDWSGAVELNKSLLKEDPKDIEALNRMALAYTVLGRIKEAKRSYQKVLNIDPLNPIALRNIKKLRGDNLKDTPQEPFFVKNIFLEETGKTKVVELINPAQSEIVTKLHMGESLTLSIKRLKIFVLGGGNKYLGVLPDDIGNRLIKLIKGGNKYEAYVKSAEPNSVTIFIKEVKRSGRFKDQPSFIFLNEKGLSVKKLGRKNGDRTEEAEGEELATEAE